MTATSTGGSATTTSSDRDDRVVRTPWTTADPTPERGPSRDAGVVGVDDLVGPRSERELRRFEAYCRWSVHLFGMISAFILGANAVATGLRTPAGTGPWAAAGPVLGVVLAAVAVGWVGFTGVLLDRALRDRPVSSRALTVFAVLGVGLTVVYGCLPSGDRLRESGGITSIAFGPVPLSVLGMLAVVMWRRRHVVMGLLAGLGALGVIYALGPPRLPTAEVTAMVAMAFWWCLLLVPTAALTKWMIDVVHRLWRSREAAADLAVAQERLRFARDLHDVFGRTLSTVAVKSELAAEFARRGDDRAVDEMFAVRDLAQSSLADVRGVVRGYRRIDLVEEVTGAQALLRTAGITVDTSGLEDLGAVAGSLPEPSADALAWSVREGVTNALRHGGATTVGLALERNGAEARLVLENDTPRRSHTSAREGSGLVGLRERLTAVGGALDAGPTAHGFRLVAHVPG